MTIAVAPPLPVLVRVQGPGGEAIAGASIARLAERAVEPLAVTDGDGCFLGDLPLRTSKVRDTVHVYQRLLVQAPGLCALVVPNFKHPGERDRATVRREIAKGGADVDLVLAPAPAIRGRLLDAAGKPAAGTKLLLQATLDTSSKQLHHAQYPLVFATDADGRFEITGPVAERAWQLLAVPSTECLARLPRSPRHPLVAFVVLAQGVGEAARDVELGELRLDRLSAVDVEVRGASGEPALGPEVVLGLSGTDRTGRTALRQGLPVPADSRGRLRLLVGPTTRLALAARWQGGMAQAEADTTKSQGEAMPLAITLGATVCVRGRALKPGDEPLAGARIRSMPSASLTPATPALLASLPRSFEVLAGEDGSFEIRVAARGNVRITAQGKDASLPAGNTFSGSTVLQVGDQAAECTIRTAPVVLRGEPAR
jgi:hypothetical protein